MARTRATAVSALVLALGLAGIGAAPFVAQSASASASAFDPVEPCDAGQCDTTPEVTVTVTTTLDTPTPEQPETTITKTVTQSPKKTSTPTPKKSSTPTPKPQTPVQSESTENLQPLPSQSIPVLPTTSDSPSQEPTFQLPSVAPQETTPSAPLPSTEATDTTPSDSVQLELRNAAPEFDQRTLTQKLSIPALVLVLLALFAVLVFEGRLRRMAHAAAVRKAGPPQGAAGGPGWPGAPDSHGYPAGPGYAAGGFPAPGYPGGTAYAPIISFVPVQTYPSGQVQYGPVYGDPNAYTQPAPPAEQHPATTPDPVVLHPDEFASYSHEPAGQTYRAPFEPLVPAEPPADIPPGGASPYEGSPEQPLGPASAAESGDSEPWQQEIPIPPPGEDVTRIQPLPSEDGSKRPPWRRLPE
ncbi:hypothetical protein ABZ297_10800 [Nonomuraea sp. NPDC005983]|uniref:hypothetical protein n=1 Tax=Nonomuraea sp. NPDC005983 TaxID=3155595 RepID=UPI0033AC5FD0